MATTQHGHGHDFTRPSYTNKVDTRDVFRIGLAISLEHDLILC
jgi:hypothetical protein